MRKLHNLIDQGLIILDEKYTKVWFYKVQISYKRKHDTGMCILKPKQYYKRVNTKHSAYIYNTALFWKKVCVPDFAEKDTN